MGAHNKIPAISVVMCVYNGLPYLEQCVRSVMDQSLRDIEIIIVDDASSDDTPKVLSRLAKEDPRIHYHRLAENSGAAVARNKAFELASGPLIAIMDADDVAHPERLMRQKMIMDTDPGLIILGTSLRRIDENGALIRTSLRPRNDFIVRWMSMFHMPFSHPTMMLRITDKTREMMVYKTEYLPAEDYEFAERFLALGRGLNMPDVLLDYRVHSKQLSTTFYAKQMRAAARVARRRQEDTLSDETRAALAPFNTAYLDYTAVPVADLFASFHQFIDAQSTQFPAYARFFQRYGSQLLATALVRIGVARWKIPVLFLRYGRAFIIPLAMRTLEVRGLAVPKTTTALVSRNSENR